MIQEGNAANQGIQGNWQSGQWTGTQSGEGQSGMGPSSLASGARWVGQSNLAAGGQTYGQGNQGYSQFGGNLPAWTRSDNVGQGWGGQQQPQGNWGASRWTGTQYGEGQPGMGGSSLSQGAHWVGQSGFPGIGGQGYGQGGQGYSQFGGTLPAWARSDTQSQGWGVQQQPQGNWGASRWTGTQYGEGQPGMGGSSLSQGAHWGGQSSFQGGLGGQQGIGNQGWTGTQYGEGQPGMGGSSLAQGARWAGQSSMGSGWMGQGSGDQQQVFLPPWTRGTQGSQGQ